MTILFGIQNNNNDCYINVFIQFLFEFKNFNEIAKINKEKNCILKEWNDLYELLINNENEGCILTPGRFIKNIKEYCKEKNIMNRFSGSEQNDFNEFFDLIMEIINNNLINKEEKNKIKHKKTSNYINKLKNELSPFLIENLLICNEEKYIDENNIVKSNKITHLNGFYLYTNTQKNELSFKEIFYENYKDEFIVNGFYDEKKKEHSSVTKKTNITYLSNILVFRFIKINNNFSKKNIKINDIPDIFIPKDYNIDNENKYELFAVINHNGFNIYGGHYYIIIKKKDKWYLINDISISLHKRDCIENKDNYCLFYRRI